MASRRSSTYRQTAGDGAHVRTGAGQRPVDALLMCESGADLMGAMETLQGRYRGTVHQTWLGPTIGANIGAAAAIAGAVRG